LDEPSEFTRRTLLKGIAVVGGAMFVTDVPDLLWQPAGAATIALPIRVRTTTTAAAFQQLVSVALPTSSSPGTITVSGARADGIAAVEQWQATLLGGNAADGRQRGTLRQLDASGNLLHEYRFARAFPSAITVANTVITTPPAPSAGGTTIHDCTVVLTCGALKKVS
jgi:hypothetical protein